MSKYQEAFSRIKEYLIHTGKNNDISFDEIRDLQELVDNQEKYKWHDLRKDPNDLPKNNDTVLIHYDYEEKFILFGNYYEDSKQWFVNEDWCPYDDDVIKAYEKIIAWKYIEDFEDE